MISGLRGRITRFGGSRVYLETGGVEYEIQIPLNVFERLQSFTPDQDIFLHIHHQFLQDDQRLYGFLDVRQRELFRALQGIKGFGSALALSVLSHVDGPSLIAICEKKDTSSLTKIPKVGKSTAETMIFEINRKIDKWKKILSVDQATELPESEEDSELELAFLALVQLGYKENQIRSVLNQIQKSLPDSTSASELIKEALRLL